MSYKDYFSAFKVSQPRVSNTGRQEGNLQEYSMKELKAGFDTNGQRINATQIYYSDGSDAFANRGFVVSFYHVPSDSYVHFKAFINAFNETFNSDWNSENVYGRTDPIRMFKQTTRSITLSLVVPASSEGEGYENLGKVQSLLSYLYPTYEEVDNALTISQSPLVRMRIMNMIRKTRYVRDRQSTVPAEPWLDTSSPPAVGAFEDYKQPQNTLSSGAASEGLLGVITNVSINHNLDNLEAGPLILADGVVVPKAIEVSLDFDVIHEKTLGWYREGFSGQGFSDKLFPYGVNLEGTDSLVQTKERLEEIQAALAAAAVKSQIERFEAEEAERNKEQMKQNAIAAGHLVASGIVDGEIQYETTKKGERKATRMGKKIAKKGMQGDRINYPSDADGYSQVSADEAYRRTLTEFIE